ncbi:MAG: amino acid ABC transporter permease [Chloroflexota bacterium]|nr:amino acid ABC transporter permease [Chloroflexota bacterium]
MTSEGMSGRDDRIVQRVQAAERAALKWFRIKVALVWIGLVATLVLILYLADEIDLEWTATWGPLILDGARTTILLTVISIVLAVMLAVLGALGRLSSNPVAYGVASLYVSLVRGTPLLVQISFLYLALPQLGVVIPAFESGVIALSFNYGAYLTEIFRAGIQAVPAGQREAAQALGMHERHVMRRIVLPQAVRIVIPAIGNDFIAMIKDSALVSTIAVQELLWRAERAGRQSLNSLQALLVAALVYWVLTIIFSFFQERLERRMARSDR